MTMGQLFYILSHIQKLSATAQVEKLIGIREFDIESALSEQQTCQAQAPVTAQRILAENPQICHVKRLAVSEATLEGIYWESGEFLTAFQALLHAECLAGMLDEPGLFPAWNATANAKPHNPAVC